MKEDEMTLADGVAVVTDAQTSHTEEATSVA